MTRRPRLESQPKPAPLPGLVDAHTHLASCGGRDADAVMAILDRAADVGVDQVVTVADDMAEARLAVEATQWDCRCYAAVALHPIHAADLDDDTAAELERMAIHPRVVAVGETGLDYYWPSKDKRCARPRVQEQAFRWHIDLAKRVGKPLMVHNREADRDLLDILSDAGAPDKVIIHCFSGDASIARECIDAGYFLSFSGTVTFTNAAATRASAMLVPDEQILVETDAPFLAPHPYRGVRNESYFLPYTARMLANLRGVSDEKMAAVLGGNARRIYNIG